MKTVSETWDGFKVRNNNDLLLCAGGGLGAEEPRHAALAGHLSAGTRRSVPVSTLEIPNLDIDIHIICLSIGNWDSWLEQV